MPCCLARLRYSRCSHIRLLKLGCTGDECADGDICPTTNQRMLLAANYRWSCEDCLHGAFAAEDAAHQALEKDEDSSDSDKDKEKKPSRASHLERTIRTLQRRQMDEASRRSMIEALRMRNNHFRRMMLGRRAAQLEEAQRVEEWVSNYGSGVFEYLYPWHGQDELPGTETGREQQDEHEHEHEHGTEAPPTTQEQPGQDPQDEDRDRDRDRDADSGSGSDTDGVSDDDMDELDEASSPSVKERRTPEQSTMWLNLLLKTKHAHMSICRDASGLYQKSQKKACQCRGSRPGPARRGISSLPCMEGRLAGCSCGHLLPSTY
ncbi:hypothetical protein E4U54_000683 [Claviceps lovelessii]|nr:hypothetical protein E4U54_000683 [Claviceps lovelessii]